MPDLVKGLGDRGFSGGDTVSRLDFLNQIGLVGEIEVVKSNLCIDVWQGGSLECQNQAVVVFPWLIEPAYAHSSFDDSQ